MERAYQVITTGIPSQPMLRLERPYFLQVGYDYLYAPWFAAFGVGMFQARLLSVLLGLGTVLLVFGIGRRLAGLEAGLLAAAFLTADSNFLGNARTSRTDMPSVFFATAALWCFLRARDSDGPGGTWRAARAPGSPCCATATPIGSCSILAAWYLAVFGISRAHDRVPVSLRRRPAAHLRALRRDRGRELGGGADADRQLRRRSRAEPVAGHALAARERRARSLSRLVLRPRHQHGAESVSLGVSGGNRRRVRVCAVESRAALAGSPVVRVSRDSGVGRRRDLCRLHPEQGPRLHAEPAASGSRSSPGAFVAALVQCGACGACPGRARGRGARGGSTASRASAYYEKWYQTQRKSELVPYESTEATLRALVPEGPKEVFASPNLWVPFHGQPGVRFVAYTGATPICRRDAAPARRASASIGRSISSSTRASGGRSPPIRSTAIPTPGATPGAATSPNSACCEVWPTARRSRISRRSSVRTARLRLQASRSSSVDTNASASVRSCGRPRSRRWRSCRAMPTSGALPIRRWPRVEVAGDARANFRNAVAGIGEHAWRSRRAPATSSCSTPTRRTPAICCCLAVGQA